ncbi:hypothetical protein AOQ84DRAFT_375694 [Glonium stellatum]|uniref:DUF4604 domain-containing protein n=1 Tax=Glonium stellatum TaxID=574774 RepID=A0A8E2F2X7_9PEZI|nr:hypothetical protein AOQ84DRAFT_375694 [Glonium stellatum]
MSFKAKNLSYDAKEPAFLRKLKEEVSGTDSDCHDRPLARPKRGKQEDDDDGPTYVLEDSNMALSKSEYEALLAGETINDECKNQNMDAGEKKALSTTNALPAGNPSNQKGDRPAKQQATEIGKALKKRKIAKVIGEEDDADIKVRENKPIGKPKKKAKVIKLSFHEDANA